MQALQSTTILTKNRGAHPRNQKEQILLKQLMAAEDVKILAKKIGVSLLVYAIPLAILSGGLLLIKSLLFN
ncbi:hypothetical protein [Spirosoma foliorum]|uniref:Uncharacterized protein n=1 Tax=Spirosoma foliorum TaxID=2710596 RepID=A0A7G5H7X8_9BACT|nr:hypothetical protein [Spirosoma foliorum]QMW07220.1 hypothetical protein H3H32_04955 [Spirosoma foliorum]